MHFLYKCATSAQFCSVSPWRDLRRYSASSTSECYRAESTNRRSERRPLSDSPSARTTKTGWRNGEPTRCTRHRQTAVLFTKDRSQYMAPSHCPLAGYRPIAELSDAVTNRRRAEPSVLKLSRTGGQQPRSVEAQAGCRSRGALPSRSPSQSDFWPVREGTLLRRRLCLGQSSRCHPELRLAGRSA